MATTNNDERRTVTKLNCPVPGCDYTHLSAQGIAGHVGSAHPGGWDEAVKEPAEIHQEATAGDEDASKAVAKVEYYLSRNDGPLDGLRVYYNYRYRSVQIQIEGQLDNDAWTAYHNATDIPGICYVGERKAYCKNEFVDSLEEPPKTGGTCSGCDRDETLSPVLVDGVTVAMCRDCRKDYWGVSS